MKRGIFVIWLFLITVLTTFGQRINFVRVCNGGNNNSLFWQINADTCILQNTLKIYARDLSSISFFGLDSGILCSSKNYVHINANVPSVKSWEYLIEYKRKCGIDTFLFLTDTLKVDDEKPDSTILDSVSVDPISNVVYLGWSSNKSPDFSSYYLYNYDRPDPRLIENYKDTFYTDLSPIDPKSKSLSYDITSSDSCDNRRAYGNYKHQTIHLTNSIDTCINLVSLSWNSYVGWPVRVYEIFQKTNAGLFLLIDSVNGSTLNYTIPNLPSGSNFQFFVRAKKTFGSNASSSTSNSGVILNSGNSSNPTNTKIEYVSNNINQKIEVQLKRNLASNYSSIDLYRVRETSSPVFIHTFNGTEDTYEDVSAVNTIKYKYFLLSKNVCGIVTDTSAQSNNIVLDLAQNPFDITLFWNKYFTWNVGVKEYIIYRATGNNVSEASNFVAIGNQTTDTTQTDVYPDIAVACYYVQAVESGGNNQSKSNEICYIKSGEIYYPNAIVSNGINKKFTFIGEGIDLTLSSIQIYNRWGGLEYSRENLIDGWEGKNNNGEPLPNDVYFFTAIVSQGEKLVNLHGNITILK